MASIYQRLVRSERREVSSFKKKSNLITRVTLATGIKYWSETGTGKKVDE